MEANPYETSPLACLPDKCLSLIVEACSKLDWKASYTLRLVCRRWQTAVETTPGAWACASVYLRPRNSPTWLYWHYTWSGEAPFHLSVRQCRSDDFLQPVAHRLVCLTVGHDWFFTFSNDMCFPTLRRLYSSLRAVTGLLAAEQIPSLRHFKLVVEDDPQETSRLEFPPLLSLRFSLRSGHFALDTSLKRSLKTLVFLEVAYYDTFDHEVVLDLPSLRHLAIIIYKSPTRPPITFPTFRTPVLESYKQCYAHEKVGILLHSDVACVTHVSLEGFTRLAPFQSVQEIVITVVDDRDETSQSVIKLMNQDPSLCPRLNSIIIARRQVQNWGSPSSTLDLDALELALYEANSKRSQIITLEIRNGDVDLPMDDFGTVSRRFSEAQSHLSLPNSVPIFNASKERLWLYEWRDVRISANLVRQFLPGTCLWLDE